MAQAVDSRPLAGPGGLRNVQPARAYGATSFRIVSRSWDRSPDGDLPQGRHSSAAGTEHQGGLDIDWSDRREAAAVATVERRVASLQRWVGGDSTTSSSLAPSAARGSRHRHGSRPDLGPGEVAVCAFAKVSPDGRISIEDREMRHGQKPLERFDGYKDASPGTSTFSHRRLRGHARQSTRGRKVAPILEDIEHQGFGAGRCTSTAPA
ncbi:MAG: hypothetical protein IPG04_17670 [Polyangiaceae bacterium]|nr:hypothetical protein [Polyangiaceae bacterium]